jgi:hypothetical protein
MKLAYKDDWEETKERYRLWWNGEYFGRCGLWVTAPREKIIHDIPPPPNPKDPTDYWTNLDLISARNEYHFSHTFFGGEAFPKWTPGYSGVSSISSFLGSPLYLDYVTGWHDPIMTGDDWDIHKYKIDKSGKWWQFTIEMLNRAVKESAGKCVPCIGAFGGCGDTLASLRDTMNLLYDVKDCPEKIRDADEYLMDMWFDVYDTFYEIIRDASDDGSTNWFGLWAPGKFYPTHNDFSYMISPKMFREIFLPVIQRQTEFLDYSVYHVDGIGAFAHVPALCELPRLQAIQILPGAGKPSPLHYTEVLKTVQSAGKNLHISIASNEVEKALNMLSAKGLFIETWASSESEARELLKNAENWSRM